MDSFKKEEFKQLNTIPRSPKQKIQTMERIRDSRIKNLNRNPSWKYALTTIAVILLAAVLFVPEFLSSSKQANEVSQLKAQIIEKEKELSMLEENITAKTMELNAATESLEMVRWSAIARQDEHNQSFNSLQEIYKIHSNYEIQDDWYLIKEDYFQIELLEYHNAVKVDFYTKRLESDEGTNLVYSDTDATDGWIYTNDNIGEIINKHIDSGNGTFEPYFLIYAEITLKDGKVITTSKLPIYNK